MSARKPLDENDRKLFRDAVGEVRPVLDDRVAETPSPRARRAVARSAERDDRAVMDALLAELGDGDFLDTGEHLAWSAPGVQRAVLKKLRSGRYAIEAEMDLHGLSVAEARAELGAFLAEAQRARRLCVRVIHGKGRRGRDGDGPRLKPAVNAWLQRNRAVLAFCSARAVDGGAGAVYVLLRRAG